MKRNIVKLEEMKHFAELWREYNDLRDKACTYIHDLVLQYGKETDNGRRRLMLNDENAPRIGIMRHFGTIRSYRTEYVKYIEVYGYEGCFVMGHIDLLDVEGEQIEQMDISSIGDWLCIYNAVALQVKKELGKK